MAPERHWVPLCRPRVGVGLQTLPGCYSRHRSQVWDLALFKLWPAALFANGNKLGLFAGGIIIGKESYLILSDFWLEPCMIHNYNCPARVDYCWILDLFWFQKGINVAVGPVLGTWYVFADFFHCMVSTPPPSPTLLRRSFTLSRCSVNTCWVVDAGLHVNPSSSKTTTRPIKKTKTNNPSFKKWHYLLTLTSVHFSPIYSFLGWVGAWGTDWEPL